jgi:hypothetical protein
MIFSDMGYDEQLALLGKIFANTTEMRYPLLGTCGGTK